MNANSALLTELQDISRRLNTLAADKSYDMDIDAVVDLNLARESVDKLINRVERLVERRQA